MRIPLLALLACPGLAIAALPQLSTDTLATDEKLLFLSLGTSRADVDLLMRSGSATAPADAESDSTGQTAGWAYGITDTVELGLQFGRLSRSDDLVIHGANTVTLESETTGWSDLGWYAGWRFFDGPRTAVAVQASFVSPTASDSPAVPETRVNGTLMPPTAREGNPGNSDSQFMLRANASHSMDGNAVDGFIEWHAEDNTLSEDDYSLGARFVHFRDERRRTWIGANSILIGEGHAATEETESHVNWRLFAGAAWNPKGDIELSTQLSHTWEGDYAVRHPSGNGYDARDGTLLAFSAGITVLMP
ncbi:MAG: hypothetical protein ACOY33_13490 [Pseudomonadota bacterium]